MHQTLIQWHESASDNTPLRWHEVGEIDDLSHVADLADLERAGAVVEVGDETLHVRPPEFQGAHSLPVSVDEAAKEYKALADAAKRGKASVNDMSASIGGEAVG